MACGFIAWSEATAAGNYILAGSIGALVGAVELVARYKDNPWAALKTPAAWLYIAVNCIASLIAYRCVVLFDIQFGIEAVRHPARLAFVQVTVAGISAMALFRSSLFSIKVQDTDLPVGFGLILQIMLNATDRAVDRSRALPRARDIPALMRTVDFTKAHEALPSFCFGMMQNVASDEQAQAKALVGVIKNATMADPIKSMLLGLLMVNIVGFEALKAAVDALDDQIR